MVCSCLRCTDVILLNYIIVDGLSAIYNSTQTQYFSNSLNDYSALSSSDLIVLL